MHLHGLVKPILALLLVLGGSVACAQSATQLSESTLPACMVHRDGLAAPVYPPLALERKDSGHIEVEYDFAAADRPPRVRIANERHAPGVLIDTVRDFASGLRLPCLPAGMSSLQVRQTYVFSANDGRKVATSRARDAEDERRAQQIRCMAHTQDPRRRGPDYPEAALRAELQGNVLVRLTFERPDQPPKVDILATAPVRSLRGAVIDHARDLRLPCLTDPSLSLIQLYTFQLDGGTRTHVRDLQLVQFLRVVKNLPRGVYFDLNTMGCPFDLRIGYYQPHALNSVHELDVSHSSRQPFLDWLAQMQFDLPESRNTKVLGGEFLLSVPCTIIDL